MQTYNKPINEALIESLKTALEQFENVYVTFTTKMGKERVMHCSRKDTMPSDGRDDPKLNYHNIIAVYDHQNSAWRSFRKDSVISFEVKV